MLSELTSAVGITGEIPQQMYEIYDRLELKDNIYEAEYLEYVQNEFSLFDESNFRALKVAHSALGNNKNLLKWALLSIEYIKNCKTPDEMQKVPMPYFDGTPEVDLVSLLVTLPFIKDAVARYESYGYTREDALKEMKAFNSCINIYKDETGRAAYLPSLFSWNSRKIFATLFRSDAFEFELTSHYLPVMLLRNNETGEHRAVMTDGVFHKSGMVLGCPGLTETEGSFGPHFIETDTEIVGYEGKDGYALNKLSVFKKSEWTPTLRVGDPAIYMHIPKKTDISPESVMKSVRSGMMKARRFFEEDIKYCYTHTWLLSPNLHECLNAGSNITAFRDMFYRIPVHSTGKELMPFLFTRKKIERYEDRPEATSLQRRVKQKYLNGEVIYAGAGILTDDKFYEGE